MKQKHEEIASERLFYAFVDFGDGVSQNPTTYIVPSTPCLPFDSRPRSR